MGKNAAGARAPPRGGISDSLREKKRESLCRGLKRNCASGKVARFSSPRGGKKDYLTKGIKSSHQGGELFGGRKLIRKASQIMKK